MKLRGQIVGPLNNDSDDNFLFDAELDAGRSNQSSLCRSLSNADIADSVTTPQLVALVPMRASIPVLSAKSTTLSTNLVVAKRSQATRMTAESAPKVSPLATSSSSTRIDESSLDRVPLALRDVVNRAKRSHAEKSNISVSKRLARDRFDLLHSVIAVRQLIGKPINVEKEIPPDLLEILNNPSQFI